jgi:hypothetical protein
MSLGLSPHKWHFRNDQADGTAIAKIRPLILLMFSKRLAAKTVLHVEQRAKQSVPLIILGT